MVGITPVDSLFLYHNHHTTMAFFGTSIRPRCFPHTAGGGLKNRHTRIFFVEQNEFYFSTVHKNPTAGTSYVQIEGEKPEAMK
jgi:hypothetical protein